MKKLVFMILMAGPLCLLNAQSKTITGKITDGREAVPNVAVIVEDSDKQTYTDASGKYAIEAEPGEVIRYSYQGMKPVRIMVEDVTRILNPRMIPDVQELEEVVITGRLKSQKALAAEYGVNPNIIRTAYGYLNADTAPGKVRFLSGNNINAVGICILDVLKAEFPGVRVLGSCTGPVGPTLDNPISKISGRDLNIDNSGPTFTRTRENTRQSVDPLGKVFIRGVNSIKNQRAAIFDVDGQIFTVPPIWIEIRNIKRIAILNNFATITSYGSAGAGGVVVINTISGDISPQKITDLARLRNNYFSGTLLTQEQLRDNGPSYLKDLYASSSSVDAKAIYERYAKIYNGSSYFFLDAYKYFYDVRKDAAYADGIIADKYWVFKDNPINLKALAYHYQEHGRQDKAHEVLKEVVALRPNYAQSYMDLANSYRDLGEIRQAAGIYNRYNYLVEEGLISGDSTEFDKIIGREYNNLLTLHKEYIVKGSDPSKLYVEPEEFDGTRLVFEWNDSEAEFELQFVNPGNQFFTWKHSLANDPEMIMKEKMKGYSSAEYLIDGSLPGTWKVNVKYLGNKRFTPSYLKATVYRNYGSPNQIKETRVFKLGMADVNASLFEVPNMTALASK